MPSRKRKQAIQRLTLWVVGVPVSSVVLIGIISLIASLWRSEFSTPIPDIIYHPGLSAPADAAGVPALPPTIPQASFTELFSGVGWRDASNTTAYEDRVATAISLVPDYSISAVSSSVVSGETIPEATSSFDIKSRTTLVIQPAYVSKVFVTDDSGPVLDFGDRFGQRAFGGGSAGELSVHPVVFSADGAWWISDGAGSTDPKLIKVSGSSVIDYTDAFPDESFLQAAPGPKPHSIYVIGNNEDYLLTDNGFKQSSVQWTSSRLNDRDGKILDAVLTRTDDSDQITADTKASGLIHYFLSNDSGMTWVPAELNQPVQFPGPGGDLRFKIELLPSADQYMTPWVDNVGLSYSIE